MHVGPQAFLRIRVQREASLRPVQYDILQARMNYYLLVVSREPLHVTRLAIDDILTRPRTSSFTKWYRGIQSAFVSLSCTSLLEQPSMHTVNKTAIKRSVQERWLTEGGASAAELELNNNGKYTRYLLDIVNDGSTLDSTYTVNLNVRTDPPSRIAMYTQVMDIRKYDGSGNSHLLSTLMKRIII